MKISLKILYCFFIISFSTACAQQQSKTLYVFTHRYNEDVSSYFDNSDVNYKQINVLSRRHIDPSRNGGIDFEEVKQNLDKYYPSSSTSDEVLVIDLENKNYKKLKDAQINSVEYKVAIEQFVSLIKFIKKEKPNVKVGVYGMPYRYYYKSDADRNSNQKLDPILELTDILFPSYYIFYPAKQKGIEANYKYLKQNLDVAFEYGKRLNKPVVPFVWHQVHPSNRKYGGEAIPKDELSKYLDLIMSYKSSNGQTADGLVWWATLTAYKQKRIKFNLLNKTQDKKKNVLNKTQSKKTDIQKVEFKDINQEFDYYKDVFEKSMKQ